MSMYFVRMIGLALCLGIALPVYAESAPVYDVDNMGAVDENSVEQRDVPPPSYMSEDRDRMLTTPPTSSYRERGSVPQNIEQRMRHVEQQVGNIQSNDVVTRTESLQEQMQALRGQVEQLTHQLQTLQQQKAQLEMNNKRLAEQNAEPSKLPQDASHIPDDTMSASNNRANTAATTKAPANPVPAYAAAASAAQRAPAATPTKPTAADQPNVAEEQLIYQTAYNQIKAKRYEDAVNALQGMLKKYPTGQFAANAHYWLGELYGLMSKNDQALTEFSTVLDNYPSSPRVPNAQLKVGLIYASQFKWPDAKSALKKVINRYPGTAPARLAAEQLKQIKLAGH